MHVFIETAARVALWTIAISLFGAGSYLVGAVVLALIYDARSYCDVCGRPMEDTYCEACHGEFERNLVYDRGELPFDVFIEENI